MSKVVRAKCPCCRKTIKFRQESRDHFIPRKLGGKLHTNNMWRICRTCNCAKGHRLPNAAETVRFSIRKGFCSL